MICRRDIIVRGRDESIEFKGFCLQTTQRAGLEKQLSSGGIIGMHAGANTNAWPLGRSNPDGELFHAT